MDWENYRSKHTNIEGARAAFEKDCTTLFRAINPETIVRNIDASQGDFGIDILQGKVGFEPITVIQCKFFLYDFEETQYQQIRESFKRAFETPEYELKEWILCVPKILNFKQNKWWTNWADKTTKTHGLSDDFIQIKLGDELIDLFKYHNLYNDVFKIEDSLRLIDIENKVDKISENLINSISYEEAQFELKKANLYLENVSHFFGENIETHIDREETLKIYDWINNDLKNSQKNILILEGEKGFGKTIVLKDLLIKLNVDKTDVLGIKADKYFAVNRIELEKKIFQKNNLSIDDIVKIYKSKEKKLIIIIDQLDALSQSLSSNREYIQTYNRLIADLSYHPNIRIIISTRSYDLNYDADLREYKSNEYANIKMTLIPKEKVLEVLSEYKVNNCSNELLELLRVPNQLDIFCKLPNKNGLNIDSLKSLKDLYDVLWKQLVTYKQELNLKIILYQIADTMYLNQQITIPNTFEDDYLQEINYLKSNNLLIENNNELQFFHQTFYDYTFSRQFVENNKSLEKYIQDNNQSLYVRSTIKMVVEYYREYSPNDYTKTIRQIIKGSKYRFHIKTLVITSLGQISNPSNDEKSVVNEIILTNFKFTEIFIGSIFSKNWLEFILNKNIPNAYFKYKKTWKNNAYEKLISSKLIKPNYALQYDYSIQREIRLNLITRLFLNNIQYGLDLILEYLDDKTDFTEKENFISRLLTNVDIWENPKLLTFFDTYFTFNISDNRRGNFWNYNILEKIFIFYPEYVFAKIKPVILKCFEENSLTIKFNYDQENFFKKINEINPDKSFDFFFGIFSEIIESSQTSYNYKDINSPLYQSIKFTEFLKSENIENADEVIENLLSEYIKSKAKDKIYFLNFFNNTKNFNSVSHLKILILGLSEIPILYKREILELINIIHNKNGFNGIDDKFQLYFRNLISKSFSLYSENEKNDIAKILLSIKYPNDYFIYTDKDNRKRPALNSFGKKKYLFLKSLPKNELFANPNLKKTFQELERKFGVLNIKQLDESKMTVRGITPPLPAKAYKKMNNEDWKSSIIKFGDDYIRDRYNDDFKGGKLEHSRNFEQEVEIEAIKFYPLIVDLFSINNVSIDYLSSGIEGLIKAKFDVQRVKELYLKLINLDLDQFNTIRSIWMMDYFINNQVVDEQMLEYLCELAINHPNPEKANNPDDPLFDSLNSVRGASIQKIIFCSYNIAFKDKIIFTVEKAANYDTQNSVKVAILENLPYLNNLDLDKSFKIFLAITNSNNIIILNNAFKAASYFNHKFYNELKPLFFKILENEELHKNGSGLIIQSWLLGYDKDKSYYNKLIIKSKTAKLKAIQIAEANLYKNKILNNKCLDILFQFLNEQDDDFANSYSGLILRKFNLFNFQELLPFMKLYSKTELFQKEPRYFLQYLLKIAKNHPFECLELVKYMKFNRRQNFQNRGQYDAEPVQLVLSIYSSLNNNFKDNKNKIEQVLVIFDEMLKQENLRFSSNKALETLK